MNKILRKKGISIGLVAFIIVGMAISLAPQIKLHINTSRNSSISSAYSTVLSSPVTLVDSTPIYEDFNHIPPVLYYYNFSMSSSNYYLFWIRENASGPVDFTLELYSDSGYSNLIKSMGKASEPVDWVVYRSSSSGTVYPAIYQGGSMGTAWLEAESGPLISMTSPYTESLSDSNAGAIFTIVLEAGNTYSIDLDVPANCDFDLYVFNLATGNAAAGTESDYTSNSSTLGQDESISVTPTSNNIYGIVAIKRSGAGVASVTVTVSSPIPGGEYIFILLGISIAIFLNAFLRKTRTRILP